MLCSSVKWEKYQYGIHRRTVSVQVDTCKETKICFNNGTKSSSEQNHKHTETFVSNEEHNSKAIQDFITVKGLVLQEIFHKD